MRVIICGLCGSLRITQRLPHRCLQCIEQAVRRTKPQSQIPAQTGCAMCACGQLTARMKGMMKHPVHGLLPTRFFWDWNLVSRSACMTCELVPQCETKCLQTPLDLHCPARFLRMKRTKSKVPRKRLGRLYLRQRGH